MVKTCTKCGKTAEGERAIAKAFYPRRKPGGYVGWRPKCRACTTELAVAWRATNPEAWAAIQERHREKKLRDREGGAT